MTAAHKPRSEQLKARLKVVQAELKEAEKGEKDETLRRLAENEQAYITATQERERYIREVFSRPVGQRPAVAEICAATGLSPQWLNKIRAKPARPWGKVSPEQAKAIREWARAHGFTVNDRGPLPHEVLDAYFGAA